MSNVAFIPLRGGSKSIPRKNIKSMCGKPLCYWSIKAAFDSNCFDKIIVSTEDQEIKECVQSFFPQIIVDNRPNELAQDTTSTEAVILEYLSRNQVKTLTLIQATSPLISSKDFTEAFQQFRDKKLDSLVTGCEFKRFLWKRDGTPSNYDPHNRPRRQDFEGDIIENGAFYITTSEVYEKYQNRLGGKVGIHVMPEESAVEIDEPSDWVIVETLLSRFLNKSQKTDFSNVKAVVLDVDGTLTDGGMYYSENGEELKKFNTKDAKGLELLRNSGIKVCIITAEDSPRVHSRMKKLKINEKDYFFGIKNKLPVLSKWCKENSISLSEVAYGGDDLGDLECIQNVGFPFCPADAIEVIKKNCLYISKKNAGHGAIREFIDLIHL